MTCIKIEILKRNNWVFYLVAEEGVGWLRWNVNESVTQTIVCERAGWDSITVTNYLRKSVLSGTKG